MVYNACFQFKHLPWHQVTELVRFADHSVFVGSISFRMINVLYFFVIIWFANILQQLISFLFGETGVENEDITPVTKNNIPGC